MPKKKIGRPAGVDSEETRARILQAARASFAANGYSATTSKMVADAADLTPAAVYFHFGAKDKLFVSAYEATGDDSFERYQAAIDDEETLTGKLNGLLNASLEIMRDDPDLAGFIAVAMSESGRYPELAAVHGDRRWRDLFDEIAGAGVATGEIDPADRAVVRGMLSALIRGLAQTAATVDYPTHRRIIHGYQRLFAGQLLHSSKSNSARRRQPARASR
jgi:AcrR family transcriptional regulator